MEQKKDGDGVLGGGGAERNGNVPLPNGGGTAPFPLPTCGGDKCQGSLAVRGSRWLEPAPANIPEAAAAGECVGIVDVIGGGLAPFPKNVDGGFS